MLIALKKQVAGFVVCEGDVIDAILIAVDLSDVDPFVTLADLGGATLLYMSDIFYTDRDIAEREASKPTDDEDVCDDCRAKARSFDFAAPQAIAA